MSTFIYVTLAVFAKLFIVLCSICVLRPIWLIYVWNRIRAFRAGFTKHVLKITNDIEISYYERKSSSNGRKSLLFVHGFSGDKQMFCDIARLLPQTFHIVALDLPGHGESKPDDGLSDYTINTMVYTLHQFIKAFGFGDRQITLIGFSMGGHIVGTYAAKYGDTISSVVLGAPAGIDSPMKTEFLLQSIQDHTKDNKIDNPLLPSTVEEMERMLNIIAYHDIQLPKIILRAFMDQKRVKHVSHVKVLKDLANDEESHFSFENDLGNITKPLLCVWGDHDEILHVSACDIIKKKVQDAKVEIIERCGHAILLDRPRKFLKILLQFMESH